MWVGCVVEVSGSPDGILVHRSRYYMALALSVDNSSEPLLPLFQPRDRKKTHKA